jgi:hypothetical protein
MEKLLTKTSFARPNFLAFGGNYRHINNGKIIAKIF